MKIRGESLTVFPTELAKRQTERRLVLELGVLDSSRLITQRKLLELCEQSARRTGLLKGRTLGTTETRLLLEEAAANASFASGQPLARLSPGAQAKLLRQAIDTFAVFAENEPVITDWLLAHMPNHKLHGIGQILKAWRNLCGKKKIADRFALNAALLRLLESGELPHELENGVQFRAVRWLNPFEERFAAALKTRLGQDRVQIISVLPDAHAQAAEKRLYAVVYSDLERGNEEEWKPWLEDFADAFEMDDGNILADESKDRVSLFVSAHPYGEIEDVARRIASEIETGAAPDEIALIVRDLSPYTDIIPDVFQRFGIPYHFRRGTPAAAHPPVKALLALLAFPQNFSRDRLCDLLTMPGVQWSELNDELRRAIVQDLRLKEPPRLRRLPKELSGFFQPLDKRIPPAEFAARTRSLITLHGLNLPDEVFALIDEVGEVQSQPVPPERLIALFEELLDNITLKDESGTESGVWIVNPLDAAGLRFESVYLAGMDDRTFPQIPKSDSLLNDTERKALRAFLNERGIPCPRLALSETGAALIQEEILFLTAMSAASKRLTLSYTQTGADGKNRAPGEFFERMRGLTGTEKPETGKSFHTILPPGACRAEDEVRQTKAKLAAKPKQPVEFPAEKIQSLIFQWLEKNPELSATALESLARNRFVFFLEKILSIRPDLTHEDDTAPMDRGVVIHDILEQIYTAIAKQSGVYASNASGVWKLAQSGEIPLAVFDPAKAVDLLALAREIAEEEFRKAERRPSRHLGHPAIWETEKQKLLQVIENFVLMDIETAQAGNRYPALFEMKFDAKHDLPVTLERGGEEIRLNGKIDRIDLIFNSSGELDRLLVVDYKSKSRNDSVDNLEKKVALNLDCQLPLYTFAAQQKFFGANNTPELNAKTQAVYHLQERELKKMASHFERKRLAMTPEITGTFLDQLFSNVSKLRGGDLATEPLIAGYDDYSHICRTVAIDPRDA
ncbi:MAG: PD-(D/E)XK nuclease family protein [Verrucomicrobia bacterium]|nr:PD-(D/E)XK nuclease family protein [Verrucomicrobiota bacterium]